MKPDKPLTTLEYLEMVRVRMIQLGKTSSDYAIAKELKINQASISRYRNRRGSMDDKTCVKVAEFLHIPPLEVIAAINAERALSKDDHKFWIDVFQKCIAASITVIALTPTLIGALPEHCILC